MNDLKWIEANIDEAKARLKKRGDVPGLDDMLVHMKNRRDLIIATEELKRQRNAVNDRLKSAAPDEIEKQRASMRELSQRIKEADYQLAIVEDTLNNFVINLPNVPQADVPDGASSADNKIVRIIATPTTFSFAARDHVELGRLTDIIDFPRAAKISGARFAFLKGAGAKLNRALMQFLCDYHVERGDTELCPPYMVRAQAMIGVGQFPKFVDAVFKVDQGHEEPYFLIPTAEAPITNYYADEILDEADLPARFCAYSPCFRSEAGAAGQDTRGLIRMHQFEKVEMVRFAKIEDAKKELDLMVERASHLLTLLELPHRIVDLCGGDLSFSSERTFDLEVWLPGQNTYREISSCSSFGSFQARRAKIRMRSSSGKIEPLITLNGSGLPLGRTIVAILENHQQVDGSIRIPKVLAPYMGGLSVITVKK